MSQPFDAIILGLGGMGSAAAFHLAARGQRVLGFVERARASGAQVLTGGKTPKDRSRGYYSRPGRIAFRSRG